MSVRRRGGQAEMITKVGKSIYNCKHQVAGNVFPPADSKMMYSKDPDVKKSKWMRWVLQIHPTCINIWVLFCGTVKRKQLICLGELEINLLLETTTRNALLQLYWEGKNYICFLDQS